MYSLLCSSYIENLDAEGQIFLVTTISIFSSKGFAVYLLSFLYSGGYTRLQGGRWSDSRALSCVERFDTFSQYWTTVSSLHQARCGLGVAVLGGMVYAIGGNNENAYFHFQTITLNLTRFLNALYILLDTLEYIWIQLCLCCKEQYCIETWNVRSMNQGKLEVVKQEMARVNVDILGISEPKRAGMGEFNSL